MKMKHLAAALMLICGAMTLHAQDMLEVKRVELDSLARFMRKEITPRIYFIKDDGEFSTFTVSAPREEFLSAATKALQEKGYSVISYDSGLYILHSRSIHAGLPASYFDTGTSRRDDGELQKYLAEQNTIVTFQNKVYEIGDMVEGRTGKAYVSGHIRDVSSGEPLAGVSVYDASGKVYTASDASGFYRIQLPIGDNVLNYSGYSLDDMKLNLKVWDDGDLDVVMKEKVTALAGAVVSADAVSHHRDAMMGLEKVRIDVVNKVPTAFGESDIVKVVLSLPGVKSVGEASSGFNVRGGSTDQNLILFNEGTIYNPSHMFGIFSAFNSDVISEVELYKSSIPAQFGGRISSVLDVRGKEGNSKNITGSLGLGLLTSRLHLEGPVIKDRTTFVLGARTTYSNWMLKRLPQESSYAGGKADFSDINASISHKVDDRNTLHAYAYWSHDGFSFTNDTTFRYSNLDLALKWRSNFSERHSMEASAGYDRYSAGFDNEFNEWSGYSVNTGIRQGFAKLNFKSAFGEQHTLSYGLNTVLYRLNPGELLPLSQESLVRSRKIKDDRGLEPALYVSDSWRLDDKLTLDAGLRYSTFLDMNSNKFYGNPEVRLSGKYSFRPDLSWKMGFNTMSQNIHLITNSSSISPMDTWKLSDESIKPQTGWQAASGMYWTPGESSVDISLEGYYKRSQHQLDYKSGAILLMNENIAEALVETYGKAYGVELMARKTSGKLTGWLSYTYSRSFLKEMAGRGAETINAGEWYNAPHDKPHDLKMVGNYKFTHRFSLSFDLDYSTGRPVTIPMGVYMYGGGYRLAYSDRNAYRIPDYFRLDLAMNIEPSHYLRQLTHMSVTFGVYNVTGRKNAYSVFFTTDGGTRPKGYMLSVFACPIPYVNLNLKF